MFFVFWFFFFLFCFFFLFVLFKECSYSKNAFNLNIGKSYLHAIFVLKLKQAHFATC